MYEGKGIRITRRDRKVRRRVFAKFIFSEKKKKKQQSTDTCSIDGNLPSQKFDEILSSVNMG